MEEEIVVSYNTLLEINNVINSQIEKGYLFVRHDTRHNKLFFKKPETNPEMNTGWND